MSAAAAATAVIVMDVLMLLLLLLLLRNKISRISNSKSCSSRIGRSSSGFSTYRIGLQKGRKIGWPGLSNLCGKQWAASRSATVLKTI